MRVTFSPSINRLNGRNSRNMPGFPGFSGRNRHAPKPVLFRPVFPGFPGMFRLFRPNHAFVERWNGRSAFFASSKHERRGNHYRRHYERLCKATSGGR